MAKSKSGGTRAMIRGRVGADVYSIGKNGKGEKQQVVRSLAETVANPQTTAQMRGRMIMSTVMQAVSGLSVLIDHSFDGIAVGQPSISEFIRRNYALIKDDVAAHPANNNRFLLNEYQQKGALPGCYQVAAGKAVVPSTLFNEAASIQVSMTATNGAALKTAWGLTVDDYVTKVIITSDYGVEFVRVRLAGNIADDTTITSENINSLFIVEGNVIPTISLNESEVNIVLRTIESGKPYAYGLIVSIKTDSGYEHNNATLLGSSISGNKTADLVLPSYPVGSERFLNGGEL